MPVGEEVCGKVEEIFVSEVGNGVKVGGEYNGVSRCEEGMGQGKDDSDGPYVFVDGNDVVIDDQRNGVCENGEKGNGIVEGDIGSVLNNGGVVVEEGNQVELGGDDTATVVELGPDSEVEVPKSQVTVQEIAECEGEWPSLEKKESNFSNGQAEDNDKSKLTCSSVESEQHQVDNVMARKEQENDLDILVQGEGSREPQITIVESGKSELHQVDGSNRTMEADENNFDLSERIQDLGSTDMSYAESESKVIRSAVSEPHQVNGGKAQEAEETNLNSTGYSNNSEVSQVLDQRDAMLSKPSGIEENNLYISEQVEDVQKSEITVMSSAELESHQLDDGKASNVEEHSEESHVPVITPADSESELRDDMVDREGKLDSVGEKEKLESENAAAELADLVPVEGPCGDSGMNLKQNLEMESCLSADIPLETEVVNGLISVEDGDCLSSGVAQHRNLKEAVQSTPEEGGSSENSESVPSTDNYQNVHPQSGESISAAPAPDNDLDDDTNQSKQDLSSDKAKSMPAPVNSGKVLIENGELPTAPENDRMVESDASASIVTENFAADDVYNVLLETDISNVDEKSSKPTVSSSIEQSVSDENVTGTDDGGKNLISAAITNNSKSETFQLKDVNECHGNQAISVEEVNESVENDVNLISSSCTVFVDDFNDSVEKETGLPTEVENVSIVNAEEEGQFAETDDKLVSQEAECIVVITPDETLTLPDSITNQLEGQSSGENADKRLFYFLIKIPIYNDESMRKQIQDAQFQVDEKTQNRDAIRAEIHSLRAIFKNCKDDFEAAMSEERAARDLLKSKRQEIDSAQSVINRAKNAISVEDMDGKIQNMQHVIEHETVPLKEEKLLIREINQMKQLREQLSSNMGKQDEVQQALDQKDEIQDRLKHLRKEVDLLREKVLKAEAMTKAAKKKYSDEIEKLNKLQSEFKAADAIRQEAYAHLQSLRKQLYEKKKYFRKYRDDANAANDYASKGEKEALQDHCVNQVETVMELWNKNDEFRKEYIRCNTRSTLRRLRTLDGRSLGPDEELPLIPRVINERLHKENFVSSSMTAVEQGKPDVSKDTGKETKKENEKSAPKVMELKRNKTSKTKKIGKAAALGNAATLSSRGENEELRKEEQTLTEEEQVREEPTLTKEEEELARKAEELRKKEEAAKLKEQQRLEEKAKAKEALERKKRNAEKAQARAALKAQKEAEEKEKAREKKAKKKERKKMAGQATTNGIEGESIPSSETPTETLKESETNEKPSTLTIRLPKPLPFTKQAKVKSIPPPLRNRGKRKMQPWMWFIILAVLLVSAVFLIGNSRFASTLRLDKFGF